MKYEQEFYTYILANDQGMLYVGVTGDLFKRVMEHKAGEGSQYTKKYDCHRLVYYESFQYVYDAIDREKQIKRYGRKNKITLINKLNPTWKDLSVEFGDINSFQRMWHAIKSEDSRP